MYCETISSNRQVGFSIVGVNTPEQSVRPKYVKTRTSQTDSKCKLRPVIVLHCGLTISVSSSLCCGVFTIIFYIIIYKRWFQGCFNALNPHIRPLYLVCIFTVGNFSHNMGLNFLCWVTSRFFFLHRHLFFYLKATTCRNFTLFRTLPSSNFDWIPALLLQMQRIRTCWSRHTST